MEAINVWFQLGLALGIKVATLEDIKCHTNHNRDGLREMLTHWLRTSPSRTWSDICNGLRSDTVKQNVLANTIEEKFNGKCDLVRCTIIPKQISKHHACRSAIWEEEDTKKRLV